MDVCKVYYTSSWITFLSKFNILSTSSLVVGCHLAQNITTNHIQPVITSVTKSWRDGDDAEFTRAHLAVHKQQDWLSVKIRFPIKKALDWHGFNATTTRNNWSAVKWDLKCNRCWLSSVTSKSFWLEGAWNVESWRAAASESKWLSSESRFNS